MPLNTKKALRFITCGSVDDGKSSLIGRMLFESGNIYDDQLVTLKKESAQFGTRGDKLDFALLVDGLLAERGADDEDLIDANTQLQQLWDRILEGTINY
jgi:sulfate adenylyltransferase subunit 1 (EFTu-like GTPase family)